MNDVVNTLSALNRIATENPHELISEAEKRYDDCLNDIVEHICLHDNIEIVLLAGPSSSGKTTTAKKISSKLSAKGHKAYKVSLDDFYKNPEDVIIGEDGKPDFETVYALDLDLLHQVLQNLVTHRKSYIPSFDFDTKLRTDKAFEIELREGDVVILEGLHALNPLIYGSLPSDKLIRLYISVSTRIYEDDSTILFSKRDLRLIRRTVRDFSFRNSPVENTFDMWDSVLEGEDKFLAPYKYCADFLINSIHNYEPCVFKDIALKLFSTVDKGSYWYPETRRLSEKLEKFISLPVSFVPADSLLREFIGN